MLTTEQRSKEEEYHRVCLYNFVAFVASLREMFYHRAKKQGRKN
jgi:hypothetical protein